MVATYFEIQFLKRWSEGWAEGRMERQTVIKQECSVVNS